MARRPWYKEKQDLFLALQQEIATAYPYLRFVVRNDTVILSGRYQLIDGIEMVDSFLIEIVFPQRYPKGIPSVYEVGGRIPRTADRHMYSSGEACLFLPHQLADIVPQGSGFLDFLNGPVKSFFVSQSYYELTGQWLFGEWPHGEKAIYEFYAPLLKTEDRSTIAKYIELISRKEIKGHWLCPCGSGKLLRHCHYDVVNRLHKDYHYFTKAMK
jgi:hypothetical protein